MALHSIVIAREVWDTRDLVGTLVEGGAIKTAALATRFEPEDLNALEMALRLKDQQGGKVTVLSLGATRSLDVLKESLYRGADDIIRVSTQPGMDTQALAKAVATAIAKLAPYDLVLTGVNIPEGENSLLGAHVAVGLGIETVSYVDAIEQAGDGKVAAKRAIEMGYETVECPLPALLSVGVALVEDDPRTPRSAKAVLKLKHKKTEAPVVDGGTAAASTSISGYEAIAERVVESKDVDPENESALKSMLDEVLKGS